MAKKNEVSGERGSKSEAIRNFCAAHPTAGPTEVAKALESQGYTKITPAFVSNVKQAAAHKNGSKATATKSKKTAKREYTLGLGAFAEIREFATKLGGFDKARAALDEVEQFANELVAAK